MIAVFAALIAVGAPVSNLLANTKRPSLPFNISALLVLWGALGEFAIAVLLVAEFRRAGGLAKSSRWLLLVLILAMAIAVAVYVFRAVMRPEDRGAATPPDAAPPDPAAPPDGAPLIRKTRGWSVP